MNKMDLDGLKSRLNASGQSHLLEHWASLSDKQKESFYRELDHMDFDEINRFFEASMQSLKTASEKLDDLLEPLPTSVCGSVTTCDKATLQKYNNTGNESANQNLSRRHFHFFIFQRKC